MGTRTKTIFGIAAVALLCSAAAPTSIGRPAEAGTPPVRSMPPPFAELMWVNVNDVSSSDLPMRDLYVRLIAIEGEVLLPAGWPR